MRKLLLPLAWLYGLIVMLRNLFFDIGLLKSKRVQTRVISVGNIITGGSGKTPCVERIVQDLLARGKRVAILSRGYKRKSEGYVLVSDGSSVLVSAEASGDEPHQMAMKLRKAIVAVHERRVVGARKLMEQFHPDVIVLDDAFQHRWLKRDLDIVVMPAQQMTNGELLLPAGNAREPESSLRRASMAFFTRYEDVNEYNRAADVVKRKYALPAAGVAMKPRALIHVPNGIVAQLDCLKGKRVTAFSGIASEASFEKSIGEVGANLIGHKRFPDHYWFRQQDIISLLEDADRNTVDALITTEKDFSRLLTASMEIDFVHYRTPIYALVIEAIIEHAHTEYETLLKNMLQ
jgi:tetraacyldisaccharide 4'-kinase